CDSDGRQGRRIARDPAGVRLPEVRQQGALARRPSRRAGERWVHAEVARAIQATGGVHRGRRGHQLFTGNGAAGFRPYAAGGCSVSVIALTTVKQYLRVTHSSDDDLLQALLDGAED